MKYNNIEEQEIEKLNTKDIAKLKMQLAWFNDFTDYIETTDIKKYNWACEEADRLENERIKENE